MSSAQSNYNIPMVIYLIENTINHKIYIGQTTQPLNKRFTGHKTSARHMDKTAFSYLHRVMAKYGESNFEISVISTASSREELNKLEMWFIAFFQSTNRDIGYNIEKGGHGRDKVSDETRKKISIAVSGERNGHYGKPAHNRGVPMSDEHRLKMSIACRGRVVSQETRAKQSKAMSGSKNPFWHKTHSAESLQKMLKGSAGRQQSEEEKQKRAKSLTGLKRTDATKKKISDAKKGELNPNYGKPAHNRGVPMSLEQKEKLSKVLTGKQRSDDFKKKMVEAAKRGWATRRAKSTLVEEGHNE